MANNTAETAHHKGLLEKAARSIGSMIGTIAAKVGHTEMHGGGQPTPRIVKGKYQKSHKHRLPRKAKKLEKKNGFDTAGAERHA